MGQSLQTLYSINPMTVCEQYLRTMFRFLEKKKFLKGLVTKNHFNGSTKMSANRNSAKFLQTLTA